MATLSHLFLLREVKTFFFHKNNEEPKDFTQKLHNYSVLSVMMQSSPHFPVTASEPYIYRQPVSIAVGKSLLLATNLLYGVLRQSDATEAPGATSAVPELV